MTRRNTVEQRRQRLGRMLRDRRDDLELSQWEVARKVDVNQSTLSNWELGKLSPRDRHLDALEDVLQLPAGALFRVAHPGPLALLEGVDMSELEPEERALIEAALAMVRRRLATK